LHNRAVTPEEMIATAAAHTARAAEGRHVLAIQDTTELNFSKHDGSKRGFGKVGNGVDIGLFLHPVVVAAADSGGILGLAEAITINRSRPVSKHRRKRPVSKKETQRWLDGLGAASHVLSTARQVTMIADRECDFYAELIAPRPDHVHLLIRSGQNRALLGGGLLFEAADAFAVVARRTIDVPARPGGRPARKAELAIGFGSVSIARPRHQPKAWPESVQLRLVVAREIDPPKGEKPIVWRLLTTHAVESLVDAERIIAFYRRRWIIEQVFRTLKTQGFGLEESQVLNADTMIKLATATLIAALRVMQLVMARDGSTGQRLSDALDQADEPLVEALVNKLEGATAKQKNPHPRGSLARLAWVVGRLGGWDGYVGHGYKPAGPKTIAYGLQRFDAVRHGWKLRQELPDHA
jgi:DDE family transposase